MRYQTSIGVTLIALGFVAGPDSHANQDSSDWSQLEKKFQLIDRLYQPLIGLEGSEETGDMIDAARNAKESGDYSKALSLSNDVLRNLTSRYGARKVNKPSEELENKYQTRLSEVNSLREAFLSITEEKGIDPGNVCDEQAYSNMLQQAVRRAEQGRYEEATQLVDGMYDTMSVAVTSLRNNETLEYELVFSNPAEEYRYELNRYQTYRLLLQMKLGEEGIDSEQQKKAEEMAEEADKSVVQAATNAIDGNYGKAIEDQEEAIRKLNSALRVLGMYLPR